MKYPIKARGNVTKLAKWAQEYISILVRRIEDLERRLDDVASTHPNSNVVIGGSYQEPDITLPPDSRIYFYAGDNREKLTNMLEVRHDHDDPNRVYIASYGTRGMHIIPSSGNSFYIEMGER